MGEDWYGAVWHCPQCLVEWRSPYWEPPLCWVCGRRGRGGRSPDRRKLYV